MNITLLTNCNIFNFLNSSARLTNFALRAIINV